MATPQVDLKYKSLWLNLFTWTVAIMVSDLPNAIWQAMLWTPLTWLFWAKIGLLMVLIFTSLIWKPIQFVHPYFFLVLVLMLTRWGMNWLRGTASYSQWEKQINWVIAMAVFQSLKLAVVFIMAAVLLLIGRRWKDFFFTRGQLDALIRSMNGKENPGKRPLSWGRLGFILGIWIAPLTLLFFGLENLPTSSVLIKALPYFPAALLFAATNAFSEEMQFMASLLGDLQKGVGPNQAIWLSATHFGLAHHFGGAPAGIPGVLIVGHPGALFAKCMLGSKGIVVPWFIHFCQNAVIYAFWAIGFVA